MTDFKKDWLKRAELDYFAPFILLWLSFNSWFRHHYSDIPPKDRPLIDKIKTDFTTRNHVHRKFCDLLVRSDKRGTSFRADIEMFHRALLAAALTPAPIVKYLNLHKALVDYSQRKVESGYIDLIRKKRQPNKILLNEIYVTDNKEQLFAGIIECIYIFRNMLVHGAIDPSLETHEIAEHSYKILIAIMP